LFFIGRQGRIISTRIVVCGQANSINSLNSLRVREFEPSAAVMGDIAMQEEIADF